MNFIRNFKQSYRLATLQGKIFYILTLVGAVFAFVNAFLNILLGLHFTTVIIALSTSAFSFLLLYSAYKKRNYTAAALVGLSILILAVLPSLWLTNSGSNGPTPYFFIFNTILIVILTSGRSMWQLIITQLFVIIGLVVIELTSPHLISAYQNQTSKSLDLSISFLLICIFTTFILLSIMNEYKSKIEALKKAQNKLHMLSITDELSGVYNRRYIMSRITDQLKINNPLSVIMFDIDNFKNINDRYGHLIGDEVIRGVGKFLSDHVRPDDTVGRIGGEEFLIIIQETSHADAKAKGEFLRNGIASLEWSVSNLTVTVSGGIYERKNLDELEDILENVDAFLYKAKSSGKNMLIH